MKAYVEYDAPVSAVVDTDIGRVERVVVWCEFLKQRDDDSDIVTVDHEKPVIGQDRALVQKIVDSVLWPAWEFG